MEDRNMMSDDNIVGYITESMKYKPSLLHQQTLYQGV